MTETPGCSVVVPAAGSGDRLGTDEPKALVDLHGTSMVRRSIEPFLAAVDCDRIIVVLPPSVVEQNRSRVDSLEAINRVQVQKGGKRRVDSVENGLNMVPDRSEYVLIHDGARPLVPPSMIERVLRKTKNENACVPVMPPSSTLKRVTEDEVKETVPRDQIRSAQTPQGFRTDLYRSALSSLSPEDRSEVTDDAMIVERYGETVHTVRGSRRNIKITYPEDLALANAFLSD